MGLCFARQQQWPRATESLNHAIALQPANPKYRNNLATVLVEMGRTEEALKQLTAVNPPAVAHYNMAYLLEQKGQPNLAIGHLQQAVARDPNLGPAHEMLARLSGGAVQPAQTTPPTGADPRLVAQPVSAPLYRTGPLPQQFLSPPGIRRRRRQSSALQRSRLPNPAFMAAGRRTTSAMIPNRRRIPCSPMHRFMAAHRIGAMSKRLLPRQ
jgi:hypothetical protein